MVKALTPSNHVALTLCLLVACALAVVHLIHIFTIIPVVVDRSYARFVTSGSIKIKGL
jgi:hypothetical protein